MQIKLFKDHETVQNLPESSWRPPHQLPESLLKVKSLAVDLETCDPNLKRLGAGYCRRDGHVIGIAVASSNDAYYFPIAHDGGDNLAPSVVVPFIKDVLDQAEELIFANATYDLGWLRTLGIRPDCTVRDIQVAEALLDEDRHSYSLNSLSESYLGIPKQEGLLELCAHAYKRSGIKFNPKGDMWKLPARYVGPYAEGDARQTYDIYQKQLPLLREEGLSGLWELECEITSICHEMTWNGVRVDIEQAEITNDLYTKKEQALRQKFTFDIWSPPQIAAYCDSQKITYPRTEKGNPSITNTFMQSVGGLSDLVALRNLNRLRKVFIEDGILKLNVHGRIHAQFLQTNREDGGTRSGRFSCRQPNLQQVPKRNELADAIRRLYISEEGCLWSKCDYNSQEPRLQIHYGLLKKEPSAEAARQIFAEGKKLYHLIQEATGVSYNDSKTILLGISYGMGKKSLAEMLGLSIDEVNRILEDLHNKIPFLSMLNSAVKASANTKGYITTLLGRKMRFNWWIPRNPDDGTKPVKGKKEARKIYPGIQLMRAYTQKSLNRLIQGGSADQTKKAMVDMKQASLMPCLPVHDEINRSSCLNEQEANLQVEIMENTIPLKIPSVVDLDLGRSWC
jgi:DNA polymerase I-like protein with 3'-5' exonuclease and polymerase domains